MATKSSKVFYITFAILAGIGFASCSKQLEEHPKLSNVNAFYETLQDAETSTGAIYPPLRPEGAHTYYQIISDALGDFLIPNNSWLPLNNYTILDNTNRNRTETIWEAFYLSIRNANLVIGNLPNSKTLSDEIKARYVGEARFMRALLYFQLVRNWGAIPLRTDQNMDQPDIPKSPESAVYDLIQNDLLYAEANLPDKGLQGGRPSKWAAKAVLADVYLQLKNYPEALAKSQEIINSGKFSLVPVREATDFLNVFGPEVTGSPEEIFYLYYARQSGHGNAMTLYEAHPNTPYANGAGYFSFYTDPTKINAFRDWDENDLRKQYNTYPFQFGRGDDTYLIRKFQDAQAITGGFGGNEYPWYRYTDVLAIFAEASNEVNNGPTDEAVEALNQIHRRAYGYDANAPSPVDFSAADYTKSTFLRLIVQERGYETLLEGKRWMELKRLNLVQEYILASKGLNVESTMLLWPIPLKELNYNKAMDPVADQNPGY
jgi:hypothetical protein